MGQVIFKNYHLSILVVVASLCAGLVNSSAWAFDDGNESVAKQAILFRKTQAFWLDQRFRMFDGFVTNDQTNGRRIDRRMIYLAGVGLERPLGSQLSVRVDARGDVMTRRQIDALSPEVVTDERVVTARPSAAVTYITPAGLEIFGGARMIASPAYTQSVDSSAGKTKIRRGKSSLLSPHVGLTRRLASGAGGFYYQFGEETDRSVTKSVSDGSSLEMTEVVHEPTTLGVFGQFSAGLTDWTVEGVAVSAGEGGERTDSGMTIRDDYMRISGMGVFVKSYKAGLGYQTAKYSKSAYMDLDSIPYVMAQAGYLSDQAGNIIEGGVQMLLGRDKQSIPEINARYEVNVITLILGVSGAF
jgi:hypothetical protein